MRIDGLWPVSWLVDPNGVELKPWLLLPSLDNDWGFYGGRSLHSTVQWVQFGFESLL